MALRGTLKDFGIADVFQLIGHQGKSGCLVVRNRSEKVSIYFADGNVVRATPESRKRKDLLGSMLVRAEAITEAELKAALEQQQTSKRRLGEILLQSTSLDRETLKTFFKLQTTEALYRLFLWDSGTYEFSNEDVPLPQDPSEVLRSEQVLMEGFRQVDEWPSIRKKIAGYHLVFEKLDDLAALTAQEAATAGPSADDPFADLDDAFSEFGGTSQGTGRLRNIGDKERLVYALVAPGRDAQKIIDLSRLGEFDTCKALCNLIDAGLIAAVVDVEHKKPSATATVGGINRRRSRGWARQALRAAGVVALVVGAYFVARQLGLTGSGPWARAPMGYVHTEVQEVLSRGQLERLAQALSVYRWEKGTYPPTLSSLVDAGLLDARDLTFPWRRPYYYTPPADPASDKYVLLRPLF